MKMSVVAGRALREQLGEEATRGLTDYVERSGDVWRHDVIQTLNDRTDMRIQHIDERFNQIVTMLADTKSEILRWSFTFWMGQTLVTIALLALIMRLLRP
jgi:hypothetical protein